MLKIQRLGQIWQMRVMLRMSLWGLIRVQQHTRPKHIYPMHQNGPIIKKNLKRKHLQQDQMSLIH
ncbi:hypothetical protein EBV26_19790 [bacterium]|nr:hypothetical protein [bacterium]